MIELTSAFETGGLDDTDYTHVKATALQVSPLDKCIRVSVQHGTVSEGVFTPGMVVRGKTIQNFEITGDDFDDLMVKSAAEQGEKFFEGFMKELYEHLINQNHYDGEVV